MIQTKLNGTILSTSDFAGLQDATLTIRQEEDGATAFSFGSNVRLYSGIAQSIINSTIFNAPNPNTAFCTIEFFDDCCKDANGNNISIFKGRISKSDIRWCEDANEPCFYECSFKDASEESEFLTCIKNTSIVQRENASGTIQSAGYNEDRIAPYLRYYEEPRPKGWTLALLFIASCIMPMLIGIGAIVSFLSFIFTFGTVTLAPRFISAAVFGLLIGDKSHVAPYLSSYIQNVCKLCGLSMQSSLFSPNGFMYSIVRLDAPFQEGKRQNPNSLTIFEDINFPNITLFDLLESLKPLNISYQIIGSDLIIERKDYFNNSIWLDMSVRTNDILSLCFEPSDEQVFSARLYEWTNDHSDKVGCELVKKANNLEDYNIPFNPLLTGIDRRTIPYSLCRSMDDLMDESVLFNYAQSTFFGYVSGLSIQNNYAIIQTGTFGIPKLIQAYPISATEVVPLRSGGAVSQAALDLNPRTNPQNLAYRETAYNQLLFIDDPRLSTALKLQNFTLKIRYYCNDFTSFDFGKQIRFSSQSFGLVDGQIDSIEFDFKGTLTITGKI